MKMYEQGRANKGGYTGENTSSEPMTWQPNQNIIKALDKAFYLSFRVIDFHFSSIANVLCIFEEYECYFYCLFL